MRSIPLAMTWEMLSHRRWALAAALITATALPLIILASLHIDGSIDANDPVMIMLHFILIQINMLVFGFALLLSRDTKRLYVLPITATTIVAWRLIPAMALMIVQVAFSTWVVNTIFELNWPLWAPAIFLGLQLAAMQAILWFTEKSGWEVMGLTIQLVTTGVWFKYRYGDRFTHYWQDVTAAEVAVFVLIAVTSFVLAVMGVARNRRGGRLSSLGILEWLTRLGDRRSLSNAPLRSPTRAQYWFEWRQKGYVLPTCVAFTIAALFLVWLVSIRDYGELYRMVIVGGGYLSALSVLAAIILGNVGSGDGQFEMGPFLATRPLTTGAMSRSILRTALQSVVLAWLLWVLIALVVWLVLRASAALPAEVMSAELSWWYFPISLIGSWLIVSLGTSAGLVGRPILVLKIICLLFITYILGALWVRYALNAEQALRLQRALWITLAIAAAIGVVAAFTAALRLRLIRWTTLLVVALIWTVLSAVVVIARLTQPAMPSALLLCLLCVTLLAILPAATLPLALHANRVR